MELFRQDQSLNDWGMFLSRFHGLWLAILHEQMMDGSAWDGGGLEASVRGRNGRNKRVVSRSKHRFQH